VPSASDPSRSSGEPVDAAHAMIGVSLGRRIRAERTAKKLSMRALASAADISQPFLSQIEGGRTMPSILTLFRLAKVLDISPSELLPAADAPNPIRVTRRDEGELIRVTEGDDSAESRVISSEAAAGATVQEYRIARVPYRGEWFESDGENTIYVIEGTVTVEIEDRGAWELRPGDALSHPGALRNRWTVDSGDGATLLLVHVL
jgi:transcriptional regulator with XRE-family HTH domain